MHDRDPPQPGTLPATVPTRARHDGWTAQRQHDFIAALAACGCVAEACGAVGITTHSAYRLRARPDAAAFRQAWDIALDYAVQRLSDAAFSRALRGTPRPVFYKGEQVGEWRHYDERLTMFLLRYRDPVRFGAWIDAMEARRHPDGPGVLLAHALNALMDAAHGEDPPPLPERAAAAPAPRRGPITEEDPPETRALMDAVNAHLAAMRAGSDADDADLDPAAADRQSAQPVRRPKARRR